MSPTPGLLAAVTAVPAVSAGAAVLACWPIRDGPCGPRLLIVALLLVTGIVAGLPACSPWLPAATEPDRATPNSRPVHEPGVPLTTNSTPRSPTCCTHSPRSSPTRPAAGSATRRSSSTRTAPSSSSKPPTRTATPSPAATPNATNSPT